MIARRVDLLPVSFDKFAAVSETLLDRDLAIVRTWQSATRPQPTSAQDRLESVGVPAPRPGRRPAVVDLVGGEYAVRRRSVHPTNEAPIQSRLCETEPPPDPHRRSDPISSPLKGELAIWRAFLSER